MMFWDREARRRRLSARLKALGGAQLVAFGSATLESAMTIAAPPRHPARTLVRAAVTLARESATPAKLDALATRIADAQPDEDDAPPPGCADLLDGASTLCSPMKRPTPARASSLASYAYQAVLERFLDQDAAAGDEAAFERAERATPRAMAFLEAQYALLADTEAGGNATDVGR